MLLEQVFIWTCVSPVPRGHGVWFPPVPSVVFPISGKPGRVGAQHLLAVGAQQTAAVVRVTLLFSILCL